MAGASDGDVDDAGGATDAGQQPARCARRAHHEILAEAGFDPAAIAALRAPWRARRARVV